MTQLNFKKSYNKLYLLTSRKEGLGKSFYKTTVFLHVAIFDKWQQG